MKAKDYLALFLIAAAVVLVIASFLPVPGYMDAEYYYANGTQLASGQGFYEPFLWNYLDDPVGIPHPAATYWMPLASMISALGMFIAGKRDFFSARIIFYVIASLIAPLTAFLSWRLSHRRIIAWLAGGLAVFPGFYAVYMGDSDTFAIYMLLGTLYLVLATIPAKFVGLKYAGLGLVAGLMHLTRADGILWFAGGIGLVIYETLRMRAKGKNKLRFGIFSALCMLLGYILVMLPWYVRNVRLYGGLFSPAGERVLWLLNYDQMFTFPASQLDIQNWLAGGMANLFQARADALVSNLQTTIAVQAEIFLSPLLVVGIWRLRKLAIVRLCLGMWVTTFLLMTLVFPLAGSRGGFFHSGAAFQPLFWAISAEGFIGSVELGVRKRNWKFERAMKGFGVLTIIVGVVLTLVLFLPQMIPDGSHSSVWSASAETYRAVDKYLSELGIGGETRVVVNNPPGFYAATGRPSIVIPDGGIDATLSAAKKYGASFLILEQNTVIGLRGLYENPQTVEGLSFIQTVDHAEIFAIVVP
jgi:hypothetical protein